MSKSTEILISLLTFNSGNFIENCLNSLAEQTDQNFKCFVFDNNSEDNIQEIVKRYPWVTFISTKENKGYTGGHNFAYHFFKKNYPNHKYMMVLNPDTILDRNLIKEFHKLFENNFTLYTCMSKKDKKDKRLWTNKNIHLPSFTFLGRYLKASEFKKGKIYSSFVMGSCFVIDLEKYKGKFLFKDYFMYHDEIELSLRLRLQGKKILATTKSYLIHEHKNQNNLSDKTVFLLEFNRLRLQSELFSDLFTLINLPFYIISRIAIFIIYRPMSQSKEFGRGIQEGLKYFQKNMGKPKAGLFQTLKFLFIDNYKY